MKTPRCDACRRGLLGIALMTLAMLAAVAAGGGSAAA